MRQSDPSKCKEPPRSMPCLVTKGSTSCLTVVISSSALWLFHKTWVAVVNICICWLLELAVKSQYIFGADWNSSTWAQQIKQDRLIHQWILGYYFTACWSIIAKSCSTERSSRYVAIASLSTREQVYFWTVKCPALYVFWSQFCNHKI